MGIWGKAWKGLPVIKAIHWVYNKTGILKILAVHHYFFPCFSPFPFSVPSLLPVFLSCYHFANVISSLSASLIPEGGVYFPYFWIWIWYPNTSYAMQTQLLPVLLLFHMLTTRKFHSKLPAISGTLNTASNSPFSCYFFLWPIIVLAFSFVMGH